MRKTVVFGTPISPAKLMDELRGQSFCVSYANRRRLGAQLERCIELVADDGLLLVDNGAWSAYQAGTVMDDAYWAEYERWALDILERCPQAVAVIPDSITGGLEENVRLAHECMLPTERCMVVWHMHEPLSALRYLVESGYAYIAIGSSGTYAKVGTPQWHARMADAFAELRDPELERTYGRPHIHMMRAQAEHARYDYDSSDSSNVAVNHCRYRHEGEGHLGRFAGRVRERIEASCDGEKRVETPAEVCAGADELRVTLAHMARRDQPAGETGHAVSACPVSPDYHQQEAECGTEPRSLPLFQEVPMSDFIIIRKAGFEDELERVQRLIEKSADMQFLDATRECPLHANDRERVERRLTQLRAQRDTLLMVRDVLALPHRAEPSRALELQPREIEREERERLEQEVRADAT